MINKPDDPIKTNHRFLGCFLNNEIYNFNTPITKDLTSFFYYDDINQKTNIENMLDISEVKEYVKEHSGVLNSNNFK